MFSHAKVRRHEGEKSRATSVCVVALSKLSDLGYAYAWFVFFCFGPDQCPDNDKTFCQIHGYIWNTVKR